MSHLFEGHEAVAAELRRILPADSGVEIPPAAFETLGAEFIEYAPGGKLSATFAANPAFANPMGVFLGAAVSAALDVLFGSLAFLESRQACTTVTLETTFVRPIFADGNRFRCEVNLRAKTKRFIFLEGRAFNYENKLAATATSTMVILD
jgi:uncharacterized protein (TIGR00369 family)